MKTNWRWWVDVTLVWASGCNIGCGLKDLISGHRLIGVMLLVIGLFALHAALKQPEGWNGIGRKQ